LIVQNIWKLETLDWQEQRKFDYGASVWLCRRAKVFLCHGESQPYLIQQVDNFSQALPTKVVDVQQAVLSLAGQLA
jgi:hypothetical protein